MIPQLPTIPTQRNAALDDEVRTSTYGPVELYVPTPAPVAPQKPLQRLARSQLLAFKKSLIARQKGRCPISGVRFDPTRLQDVVVDHNHKTGEIRGALTRSANAVEGKVKNAVARWGGTGENYDLIIPYLERLVAYLKNSRTGVIYPMHKTEDDKRMDRNKKAREQRAARLAKQRLQEKK